jgi:hypothetical protein
MSAAPVLGLIFPPSGRGVPEEGVAMYGDSLRYVVTSLGPLNSSMPHGLWAGARLVGLSGKTTGHGKLFSTSH